MKKSSDASGDRNTISGRVVRRQTVPVFYVHRLPLTGIVSELRWLIGDVFFIFLNLTSAFNPSDYAQILPNLPT
jgi:hypothetical protein